MQGVNPFVLCNLAAKYTRKTFRPYATATLEVSLKANTRAAVAHLKSGTQEEIDAKNMRQHEFSFVPEYCEPGQLRSPSIEDGSE